MALKRRNTEIKEGILHILTGSKGALSQTDVEEQLNVPADRATIFRTLNRFVEDGIAHRIVSEEGKSYFAVCTGKCASGHHHDAHYHFHCLECRKMECMKDEIQVKLPKGYKLMQANVVLTGICAACR